MMSFGANQVILVLTIRTSLQKIRGLLPGMQTPDSLRKKNLLRGLTARAEPTVLFFVIAARDRVSAIVNVQVVSGRQSLDDAHCAKRRKYGDHRELVKKVAGILGLPGAEFVMATSCSISWRGVRSCRSFKEMKRFIGLPTECLERIPGLVLRGTHMNWTSFNHVTAVSAEAPDGVSGACG